jgi:23S rRNA (cytosine1962-C5)-methyltransferase
MPYSLYLKKGEERRLLEGHPWVYANEVSKIEGKDKQGSIAKVYSFDGKFIGQGYINHISKIIVRLLSRDEREINESFFREKIQNAWNMRKDLGFNNSCRVVFGEADGLPGLVVDKYGDYLAVQVLALGIEVRKDLITGILKDIFNPKGIYERSDVSLREKEGMEPYKGLLYGEVPERAEIEENGVKMLVDIMSGQKTGHFLDQKENRAAIKPYVSGKRVLDCFSHSGGFALHAMKYGASEAVAVDISDFAVETIKKNADLNGFKVSTVCADVFDYLRDVRQSKESFDTIILDPPAFTKSRENIKDAIRGYKDINVQAMKILKHGGYLISCSCSYFVTSDMFIEMLLKAGNDAGVSVRLLELRSQSRDHAVLLGSEESNYLKCAILRIEH